MTSFTSNSNPPKPRPMLVLLCSAIAVVSFAMVRPKPTSFSNPSWYWQAKVEWKKCANIVLAGNSRTYRGLSPVEFEKVLGGTAVNAGFSSGTYSKEYCDYLETLFDEDDSTPNILVAGITHNAICDLDRKNNGFLTALKKSNESTISAKQNKQTREYAAMFESLVKVFLHPNNDNYIQEFFDNGWVASDYKIKDINYGLLSYKRHFEQGKYLCNDQELNDAVSLLTKLSTKGIDVYCLWLPTSPPMLKLENERSGMHRNTIGEACNKHDLSWISFSNTDFTSYDGSHLDSDSAIELSMKTAIYIKANPK